MARPCLRCQAPSSRGRQNGTAAVDPPCTCRFINGTTRHRGSFSSALPLGSLRGAWFYVARTRRSQRADSGSFVQIQRQSPCQYVNYCLRSFPCLCATPLAVRLFARTSSSLCRTSYPFIALLLYRLRALSRAFTKSLAVHLSSHASPLLRSYFFTTATEPLPSGGYGVLGGEMECTSRGECCSPTFPSGFPPPLVKSAALLKCGIYFSSFLIKFESRIEIIERQTE